MGYPTEFIKNPIQGNQYKQISNSVAINVIEAIGNEIINQKLLQPNLIKNIRYEPKADIQQLRLFDFA